MKKDDNKLKQILTKFRIEPNDDEFCREEKTILDELVRQINLLREASINWREGNLTDKEYAQIARDNNQKLKQLRKRLKEFRKKWGVGNGKDD